MCSGVSKSGSPAVRVIISFPCDLSSVVSEDIAIVEDGLTLSKDFERKSIKHPFEIPDILSYVASQRGSSGAFYYDYETERN